MILKGRKEREASDGKLYILPASPHVSTEEAPFLQVMELHCRHPAHVILPQTKSNRNCEESGKPNTTKEHNKLPVTDSKEIEMHEFPVKD